MKRNLRVTLAAAGFAGLMAIPAVALAAPSPTGDCAGTTGPSTPNGAVVPVADPTGQAPYVYSSGGDPTGGAGFVGVSGSHGYLEVGGNANTQSGGVSGHQTESGLNGTLTPSGICVNGNSAP
jgi:hypothetical protein